MNWHVTRVEYLDNYRLLLDFRDGSKKVVDLGDSIVGEIFEPLRNVDYFRQVRLNPELDTIYWDNGADFAPEFLYEKGIVATPEMLSQSRKKA